MNEYGFSEKDWKLFRSKVPGWQEAYMDGLIREYITLLSGDENPSEKFWALDKRIRRDKRSIGVVIDMRRSIFWENIVTLIRDGVIGFDDLDDFSEDVRERVRFFFRDFPADK